MLKLNCDFYLASQSPRREKLLEQIGLKPKLLKFNFNEEFHTDDNPLQTVKRIANHKMDFALQEEKKGIILTADTIVVLNNKIIGKPNDKDDAFKILNRLSHKTHLVYTGFVLYNTLTKKRIFNYSKSKVTFRKLQKNEIWDYIESGSPMDKAGAYGIQDDYGAVFVEKISGCYYNVVGLPLSKVFFTLSEII
ncbi:MAG: septum formation protein Maf [Ignavibacteriaceae bacterium]|nr:septum formation protein Maf [Ignavibacteriaceae bacterium]